MKELFAINLQDYNGEPILKYSVNQKNLDEISATRLGRTLLISNRTEWLPEEVIGSYRSLANVEETFKYMKNRDYLRWQPSFHWTDQKIEVHTLYCVIALLLATLARKIVVESGLDISLTSLLDDLSGIKEIALLYKSGKKGGVEAKFTVNTMTARQKKIADLFQVGEIIPQPASNLEFGPRQSPGVGRSQIGPYLLILTDLRSSNRGSFRVGPNPSLKPAGVYNA